MAKLIVISNHNEKSGFDSLVRITSSENNEEPLKRAPSSSSSQRMKSTRDGRGPRDELTDTPATQLRQLPENISIKVPLDAANFHQKSTYNII